MDASDFKMPSPKRQRTESPDENAMATDSLPQNVLVTQSAISAMEGDDAPAIVQAMDVSNDENSMLDTLMQHVEAESTPDPVSVLAPISILPTTSNHVAVNPVQSAPEPAALSNQTTGGEHNIVVDEQVPIESVGGLGPSEVADNPQNDVIVIENDVPTVPSHTQDNHLTETSAPKDLAHPADTQESREPRNETSDAVPAQPTEILPDATSEMAQAAALVDGIPPTLDSMQSEDVVEGAEWEVDSSPYESSSDSDSSSDDSSDEDADGDYAMLDPEEQARILMQGDGGSDDEGEKTKTKSEGAGLKTANEQAEDVLPIPDITITEDMKVEELGVVEGIVDRIVLIKAKVSGEYQVLDSGSLLCLQDRRIAGVVAELLGRVEQPMYMVRFKSDQEIEERGLSERGTTVYYVPSHSSFVFTQPLKAIKGSDASNFHDEEVGDEEMEFSDDEAEAEHKRSLKLKRQGKTGDTGRGRGSGRGGQRGQRGGRPSFDPIRELNGAAYGNGSLEMNYDEVNDGEEGYTPLARPTNLHEMMDSAQPMAVPGPGSLPPFTQQTRGRGRGGREGRGRGRGDRGRGSNNRGAMHPSARHSIPQPPYQTQPLPPSNSYQQPPFPFPPPPPMLTAQQTPNFSNSLATSPMSPLPTQQFNFGAYQNHQNYNNTNHSQPQYQQHQNTYYNPSAMQQQYPPQQQPQQQYQPPSNGGYQNGWQNNQAAIAEVQRQLEQMRRGAGGGHQ